MCQLRDQPSGWWKGTGSEISMRPEEARIGRRVRVRNDHRKTSFRDRQGIIAKRWGDPTYPALDVLLDDGVWQLFWFHELEEVDEDYRGARDPVRSSIPKSPYRGARHARG
jgi:hypothetical protein